MDALREDAKAAKLLYQRKQSEYEDAFEPLPKLETPSSLTLCFVRNVDGDFAPGPTPKKSLWQRLRAFFGRLWKRLTWWKKEPGA